MAASLTDAPDLSNLDATEDGRPHTFRTIGDVSAGLLAKIMQRRSAAALTNSTEPEEAQP